MFNIAPLPLSTRCNSLSQPLLQAVTADAAAASQPVDPQGLSQLAPHVRHMSTWLTCADTRGRGGARPSGPPPAGRISARSASETPSERLRNHVPPPSTGHKKTPAGVFCISVPDPETVRCADSGLRSGSDRTALRTARAKICILCILRILCISCIFGRALAALAGDCTGERRSGRPENAEIARTAPSRGFRGLGAGPGRIAPYGPLAGSLKGPAQAESPRIAPKSGLSRRAEGRSPGQSPASAA